MRAKIEGGTWFDPESPKTTRWAAGDQALYRTAGGAWVVGVHDPKLGDTVYRAITPGEALTWFGPNAQIPDVLRDELGPRAGRKAEAPDGKRREPRAVRLSPGEQARIESQAEMSGRSWSEHLRYRLLESVDVADRLRILVRGAANAREIAGVIDSARIIASHIKLDDPSSLLRSEDLAQALTDRGFDLPGEADRLMKLCGIAEEYGWTIPATVVDRLREQAMAEDRARAERRAT